MAVLSRALALTLAAPLAAHAARLLASHFSGTVYSLDLSDDGALSILDQDASARQRIPTWISWDPVARIAYVTDESWFGPGSGVLAAYQIADDGALSVSATARTDGGGIASGLYGGDDGNAFLGEANYNDAILTTWALPLSSSSKPLQTFKYTIPSPGPVPGRQNAAHLHSVFTDPTGRFLLAADLGADLLRIWRINTSSGALTECAPIAAAPGDGPRHGAFTTLDDGTTVLYVVNELANSVSPYPVSYPDDDDDAGCLQAAGDPLPSLSTYEGATPSNVKAAEIRVAGRFVYASNRNDETFGPEQDSIAVYEIDPATGALEALDYANAHGFFPRTFAVNAAGDRVAVGGQTDAVVAVLERDPETGLLGELVDSVRVGRRGTVNGEDGLSAVVWIE